MNSVSRRTTVPMMPVHLPYFISIMESMTVTQTTARPTTIDQPVLIGSSRIRTLMAATDGRRQRAADPHRVGAPVDDGGVGAGETAEGHAHPGVGPAFDREGRPHLGDDHAVGDEVDDDEEGEPDERLAGAVGRGQRDRVEADERGDREEDQIKTVEHLLELLALLVDRVAGNGRRGGGDVYCHLTLPLAEGHTAPSGHAGGAVGFFDDGVDASGHVRGHLLGHVLAHDVARLLEAHRVQVRASPAPASPRAPGGRSPQAG